MNTQRLKHNYKIKAAIFALAFLFWLIVKMIKVYDYTLDIPLRVTINNEDICLKHPAPEKVRVEFSGRGVDLLQLNLYRPYYEVDLSEERNLFVMNLTEYREYVRLSEKLGVSVKSIISPHEARFELDRRRQKKIPLQAPVEVKTEPGFILVNTVAHPESILVVGPASFLDTLKMLVTEEKSYSGIDRAFTDDFQILTNHRFYAEYIPRNVKLFFDVQRLAEKEVANVPVKVINVPAGYEVVPLPPTVKVYVKGGEKILAEAEAKDFVVQIDFSRDWRPNAAPVRASVRTDLNVSYLESRPPYFELIVEKKRNKGG